MFNMLYVVKNVFVFYIYLHEILCWELYRRLSVQRSLTKYVHIPPLKLEKSVQSQKIGDSTVQQAR